jgi:deoxyribose-phosphate aldolase
MHEVAAGGVVRRGGQLLVIRDRYGRWTFPKGHLEEGETLSAAAEREVAEETGVTARVVGPATVVRYEVPGRANTKEVHFFPMVYCSGEVAPLAGEVAEARWCSRAEAEDLLRRHGYGGYADLLGSILRAAGGGG